MLNETSLHQVFVPQFVDRAVMQQLGDQGGNATANSVVELRTQFPTVYAVYAVVDVHPNAVLTHDMQQSHV